MGNHIYIIYNCIAWITDHCKNGQGHVHYNGHIIQQCPNIWLRPCCKRMVVAANPAPHWYFDPEHILEEPNLKVPKGRVLSDGYGRLGDTLANQIARPETENCADPHEWVPEINGALDFHVCCGSRTTVHQTKHRYLFDMWYLSPRETNQTTYIVYGS